MLHLTCPLGRMHPLRSLMHPATEQEFRALMGRVDEQLRADGVPIPLRVLKAQSMLAAQLKEPFIHPYPKREPREGVYSGHDLTIRVERWFEEHYGRRLSVSFSPASVVLLLRGDPWLLELPRLIGRWTLIASRTELSDPPGVVPSGDAPPSRFNIVTSISDLPPGLLAGLTDAELEAIRRVAQMALDAYHRLEALRSVDLIWEAVTDHAAAVRHLVQPPTHFGQAKWAALQALEKVLKACIRSCGEGFASSHNLSEHAAHCERLGVSPLDRSLLALVQCPAGVRYGTPIVTVTEAVAAHHAALDLCRRVADYMIVQHVQP